MKSPLPVRSEKLLFSTPSAMPRNATSGPSSYSARNPDSASSETSV